MDHEVADTLELDPTHDVDNSRVNDVNRKDFGIADEESNDSVPLADPLHIQHRFSPLPGSPGPLSLPPTERSQSRDRSGYGFRGALGASPPQPHYSPQSMSNAHVPVVDQNGLGWPGTY